MPIAECGFAGTADLSAADALLQWGPTLLVDIGFDPDVDYSLMGAAPKSGASQVPALVDTGAIFSCIDDDLAKELNLPLVDRAQLAGVGGRHEASVYLAHITVPALAGFYQYGIFYGVSLVAGGQQHRALIGRTLLQSAILIYDGRTGQAQIAR